MPDDDDLFSYAEAHARSSDPWTSHAAAEETEATKTERLVWQTLCACARPMTTYEIAVACSRDDGSITPRMKPLETKGLVRRVGTKMGPRRRQMTLWVAAKGLNPRTGQAVPVPEGLPVAGG